MTDLANKLFDDCAEVTKIIPISWCECSEELCELIEDIADYPVSKLESIGMPVQTAEWFYEACNEDEDTFDTEMVVSEVLQTRSLSIKKPTFFVCLEAVVLEKKGKGHWHSTCVKACEILYVEGIENIEGAIEELIDSPEFQSRIRREPASVAS
ncbi:MAG: hypothetical protein AAGD09_03180 [Cyanobacteria bacterium P01_F01_bin.56]